MERKRGEGGLAAAPQEPLTGEMAGVQSMSAIVDAGGSDVRQGQRNRALRNQPDIAEDWHFKPWTHCGSTFSLFDLLAAISG